MTKEKKQRAKKWKQEWTRKIVRRRRRHQKSKPFEVQARPLPRNVQRTKSLTGPSEVGAIVASKLEPPVNSTGA